MKNRYLLVLLLLITTTAFSQASKVVAGSSVSEQKVSKEEVIISPKTFYGTLGVLFDFATERDIVVEVTDLKQNIVYKQSYSKIKNSSLKLNLADLSAGKYIITIKDSNEANLYSTEIEKKN